MSTDIKNYRMMRLQQSSKRQLAR